MYNILNGDSLAHSFPNAKIEGDIIVVREALMDGDLSGDNLNDFWQSRAKYHGSTDAEYHSGVSKEFEKIKLMRLTIPSSIFGLSMTCSARLICGLLFQSSMVCQ